MAETSSTHPTPQWPKEEPDAATMVQYAAGTGIYCHGLAQGRVEAGVFADDCPDDLSLRYMAAVAALMHQHDLAFLLQELRKLDPDVADRAAGRVWTAAVAGDSYGEWLWQWAKEAGLDPEASFAAGEAAGAAYARPPSRSLVEALGEDDGERWYAQGHVDPLAMALSVLVVEMHMAGPAETARNLLSGTFSPGTVDTHHDWLTVAQHLVDSVGYVWAREDESRGDGYFQCEKDDDGAEEWTELRL